MSWILSLVSPTRMNMCKDLRLKVSSDITKEVTGGLYIVMTVMKAIFARSTETGSRTLEAIEKGILANL
jgi:hypothetical protein